MRLEPHVWYVGAMLVRELNADFGAIRAVVIVYVVSDHSQVIKEGNPNHEVDTNVLIWHPYARDWNH